MKRIILVLLAYLLLLIAAFTVRSLVVGHFDEMLFVASVVVLIVTYAVFTTILAFLRHKR